MNATTGFDLGPLTWVKGEIDLALDRGLQALQQFQEQHDPAQLQFCRTYLHQVYGALSIVGLDGVTRVTEALESLLKKLEAGELTADVQTFSAAYGAFSALRQYLNDLVAGEPNQTLRLLPVYQALMQAQGEGAGGTADLFFPDLSARLPRRSPPPAMTAEERVRLLRAERTVFQKGLLSWLREPEGSAASRDGLVHMQSALRRIESIQPTSASRAFWWAALGMVTALLHGAAHKGDARALCARIDLQIRRLLEGNAGVADRLLRDALYYVAQAPAAADPLLAEIQSVYQLESLLPDPEGHAQPLTAGPQEEALRRLCETIDTAEDQWNRFCSGTAGALSGFVEQLTGASALVATLGQVDLVRLVQALLAGARWLAEDSKRHTDGIAMEMATALLLLQTALENYARLGTDFTAQVDVMLRRLQTSLEGGELSGSDLPLLDEMSRKAQERLLMTQVAREILNNLAQIEQALDTYFRDTSKRPDLACLEEPLHQISGALTILGQDAAVAYLKSCEDSILQFAHASSLPAPEVCEDVAHRLSVLGFFVETLQHGEASFEAFLKKSEAGLATADQEEDAVEHLVFEAPVVRVEDQLSRLKAETREVLEALKVNPGDEALRTRLQQHLKTLQKDADLVADQALLAQAKAALAVLAQPTAPEVHAVEAVLAPMAAPALVTPSAQTLQLAQASTEELDAELLAIFLEEAEEVLATVGENLAVLKVQPHNVDVLTTIRRSAHTLKGSGRMVGLKDLGETAWAVEQTLNLWLRQELAVTPELLDMIALMHQVFSTWVEHLTHGEGAPPDADALVALAGRLRGEEVAEAVTASAPPPVTPTLAVSATEAEAEDASVLATVVCPDPEALLADDFEFDPPQSPSLPALSDPRDEEISMAATEIVPEGFLFDEPFEPEPVSSPELALSFEALEFESPSTGIDVAQETPAVTTSFPPHESGAQDVADGLEILLDDSDAVSEEGLGEDFEISLDTGVLDDSEVWEDEPGPVSEPAATEAVQVHPEVLTSEHADSSGSPDSEVPALPVAPEPAAPEFEISPQLYEIFSDEARGHLNRLHQFFAELTVAPSIPTPFEIGRAAHTLAGIAGAVGILSLNRLGKALENALLRRSSTAHPESIEGQEVLRQTLDMLEEMFSQLAQGRMPEEQHALIDALSQIYPVAPDSHQDPEAALQTGTEQPAPEVPDVPEVLEEIPADLPAARSADGEEDILDVSETPEMPPLLQDELDPQLLPIFLEEAQDLVSGFQIQLSAWKQNHQDDEAQKALARLLHTFKGSARMAGAMTLGQLTHAIETRVGELTGASDITEADLEEIEEACDVLAVGVERLLAGDTALPEGGVAATEAMAATPAAHVADNPVASFAPVAPVAPEPRSEAAPSAPAVATPPVLPDTANTAEAAGGAEPAATQTAAPSTADHDTAEGDSRAVLRVRADLVDRLVNEAGELSIARARIEGEMRELKDSLLDLTENVIRLRRQLREIEIQAETQIQAGSAHESRSDFDPLELDRFTRFQELTRMMAESVNDVATVQQNLLKNLDDANAAISAQGRLNRSLQQSLMSVRMVPFSSQGVRLYRLVRQTAKGAGKRVNLEIEGGQVELDRSVLEKVLSPLEHMLRNAVVHGLESTEERLTAGKNEIGGITLSLVQEGNEIILSLSDNGRGLDQERIRAKAIADGLLSPEEKLDARRLVDLIFRSGFTTATEVSQVAGRGVGMDVVKTEITALGGRIEVETETGIGTTFRLYLPLTLAVTQTVLVCVRERTYAIPSTMVDQVMEVREKVLDEMAQKGEVLWQGHHYPFHYLPRLLGDSRTQPEVRRLNWVLLLRSGNQRIALHVDMLRGNQEIVVKNVGPQMARVVGIAGATVLGDGQVILILNPVALATRLPVVDILVPETMQDIPEASGAPDVSTPAPVKRQPIVFVVDDSLTVRKITGKLLAREGYQVELAKDGVDALEQLIDLMPDVILSDIEMPRMDGFDLVRNIRADGRFAKVPIIMITSRTAEKHRNYAMEIGANHYLGKPYNEEELLGLLATYTGKATDDHEG